MPPLYDDIIDAFELDPAGGSISVDLVGATLQTNEIDISCNPPGWSVWLKVDLSGTMSTDTTVTLTAQTTGGAILPEAFVAYDTTGTFDPSSPNFDLLSFGDNFVGDGTATPPPADLIFNPTTDGNPTGIYYIAVGNYPCDGNDGQIGLDWPAFSGPPDVIVVTLGADVDSDTTVDGVHGTINPNNTGSGHYWFEYGTTLSYGSATSHLTYSNGTSAQPKVRNLSGLSPGTPYHYRLVAQRSDTSEIINGNDETFTTFVSTDPSTGVTLDPDQITCAGCVRFNATVDPDQADTIWQFKYHLGTSGGSGPTTPGGTVLAGSGVTTVHETICGLTAGRRYQVKVLDSNWNDGVDGDWVTFDVPMCPFGTCTELVDDFTGAACAYPDGTTGGPGPSTLTGDGLRLTSGALMSLNTTDTWQRQGLATLGDPPASATGVDWWITLSVVSSAQGLLIPDSLGGFYGVRHSAGTISIIQFDGSFAEIVLASGGATLVSGNLLGIRWQGTTVSAEVSLNDGVTWTVAATTTVPVDYYDARSEIVIGEMLNTPFDRAIPDSDVFDLSSYGTSDGSLGCPVGTPKYEWNGSFIGFHVWSGPYFGGPTDADYPNPAQNCPSWWADLKTHAYGRIDCSLESIGNAGDDGFLQSYLSGTEGITAALVPFYPDTSEYNTELSNYESDEFGGFLTWDSDFAHKGNDAILASLPTIAVAYAAQGAFQHTNVGDGGRHSYGVFMPVAINPARMDDLFGGFGCSIANDFGPVSFSGLVAPKKYSKRSIR